MQETIWEQGLNRGFIRPVWFHWRQASLVSVLFYLLCLLTEGKLISGLILMNIIKTEFYIGSIHSYAVFLNVKNNRLYMYFYINVLSFFTWKKKKKQVSHLTLSRKCVYFIRTNMLIHRFAKKTKSHQKNKKESRVKLYLEQRMMILRRVTQKRRSGVPTTTDPSPSPPPPHLRAPQRRSPEMLHTTRAADDMDEGKVRFFIVIHIILCCLSN